MAFHRATSLAALAALVLTTTACPAPVPEPGETAADSEGSTGGSTSFETGTTEADTVDAPTEGGQSSSSSEGGQSSSSSEGTGSSSGGETGVIPGLEEGCQAYCDSLTECFPEDPPPADCADLCVEEGGELGLECGEAAAALYACLGDLTCEQVLGEDPQCVEEGLAVDDACDDG